MWKLQVLGIAFMRALGRIGVKLQRGIVEFFKSDFAGVKTGDGIFPHHGEELAAKFLTRPVFFFESERLEQRELLRRRELQEALSVKSLTMTVEPHQSCSEWVLLLGIMRDHEVDKLRDSRLFGSWRLIGGNDDIRNAFDHRVLGGREKVRMIFRRFDLQSCVANVSAGESPFAKAWESSGGRSGPEDAQNFSPMNPLSGHDISFTPQFAAIAPPVDAFERYPATVSFTKDI